MADDDRQAALNAIDLKGNIVLKEFGDTALLFRPQNNYEPFVVAYGYDKAAGEWSHGSYHTDLGHAFEEANPEIIEDVCVRWQRGDIATALGNEEYPATDANVSWILNRSTMGDFHEEMTAARTARPANGRIIRTSSTARCSVPVPRAFPASFLRAVK